MEDIPPLAPRQKGQSRKRERGAQARVLFPYMTTPHSYYPVLLCVPWDIYLFPLPCLTINSYLLQEACPDHPSLEASLLGAWGLSVWDVS